MKTRHSRSKARLRFAAQMTLEEKIGQLQQFDRNKYHCHIHDQLRRGADGFIS